MENEELSKEILALEKELSQLENECSKEASMLAMQQKIAVLLVFIHIKNYHVTF